MKTERPSVATNVAGPNFVELLEAALEMDRTMEIVLEASQDCNPRFSEHSELLSEFFEDAPAPVQLGPAIPRLFADAVSPRLKYPHITLRTSSSAIVVLRLAGAKSPQPGSVTITSEGKYGYNTFYGRITATGELQPARAITAEIVELLRRFSDDPIAVASECGRITGNCSFCRKPLSDPRSTACGYGETCARGWKLPWRANRGLLKVTGGLYGYVWDAVGGTARA